MLNFYQRNYLLATALCLLFFWDKALAQSGSFSQFSPIPNPSPCGMSLPIHDFSCDPTHYYAIEVANAPGTTLGTNVFLREVRFIIQHEWVADLDITLRSPSGKLVELSTDNGSGNDNYGNLGSSCAQFTTLISHASPLACNASSIASATAPFIGNYLPEGNFNTFNDSTSVNGTWTLIICDDGMAHYGTLEFVELVFEATSCNQPSGVTVTATDSTSAMLNWTPGNHCTTTLIEYGPPGFAPGVGFLPGEGNVVLANCPPFTLSGLAPSGKFEVYVREFCGGNQFSENGCPVAFQTKCSPPPATIVENFNTQTFCDPNCGSPCNLNGVWRNAQDDDFDWISIAGPTSTTLTGPDDDFPGGGFYLYIETSGTLCRNGRGAELVSNCIEVHANPDSCDFSFDYHLFGVHVNAILLEASTDGGATWQFLWEGAGNQGDRWQKKFIDLDAFDGQVVQFRFTGKGGNGFRGDLALDNLVFYGSEDLGLAPYIYYMDADGDGYGQQGVQIAFCQPNQPAGFVANNLDCDDFDPFTNPGAAETPCDGFDFNCNGMSDEQILPPMAAFGDTVCSGAIGFVTALPGFGGEVNWYDSPLGGNLLHTGISFSPQPFPENLSSSPETLTFFAEEISPDSCISIVRTPASIVILPNPDLSTANQSDFSGCAGEIFDLTTVNVTDANGSNGVLTYFQTPPFVTGNQIIPIVQPSVSTTFYIVSTASGGCTDALAINYVVESNPLAEIQGASAVTGKICRNSQSLLTAADLGNGVPPLSFLWNNGSIQPDLTIFSNPVFGATDFYAVTITGENGCSSSDSLFVTTTTSITGIQISTQSVTACNGNNGSVTLIPVGGVPPFQYQWAGGGSTTLPGSLTLNGLSQGTYSFTITDSSAEGCEFYVPVVVVNGPSAIVSLENVADVSCNGGSDGCIEIEVVGGNPSILWSNGFTGEQNCGLAAGTYSVTVTENGCSNILEIPVDEPEPLTAFPTVKEVRCFGGDEGSISLSVFGGTPPYQFTWNNNRITQNITQLSAGAYSVTIMDASSCQFILPNIQVGQPDQLGISTQTLTPVSCHGRQDGQIVISPSGGKKPYSFAWSNGATGSTVSQLAQGNYVVTVTDANGCSLSKGIFMTQPAPVSIQIDQVQDPVCNGINDGSIQVSVAGGNGGYLYSWSKNGVPVGTLQDIHNLGEGTYTLHVSDQKGCTAESALVNLEAPASMALEISKTDPYCLGMEDGSIEVGVLGGKAPYEYSWNTDESGSAISNLPPGIYIVTVTDADGCMFDTSVVLLENQPLHPMVSVIPPACHGTASGQLAMVVAGGVQPYQILWSTGQSGNSISGLLEGNYSATVTDDLGCLFFLELITLEAPPPLEIDLEVVESIACHGGNEGGIQVLVSGGTSPYEFNWSNGASSEDLSNLEAGFYSLTVTDDHNCVSVSLPFQVASPDSLSPSAAFLAPTGCEAFNVDTVCVEVTGGVAPYQFLWTTGETTSCLFHPLTGDYTVTITDAAGCTTDLMSVKVPEEVSAMSVEPVTTGQSQICAGASNGSLAVLVQGGVKPYQFIWSNGELGMSSEDTLVINGLPGNSYNVTITDAHGCVEVSPMMLVTSFTAIQPSIPGNQVQHVRCKGGLDGSINLNVTGGFSPYAYAWTNQLGSLISQQQDLQNLPAGTYTVVVTDDIGCTATVSAQVNEPASFISIQNPPPVLTDVSCYEATDGTIDISPSGGVPPYTFNWNSGQTTEDLQNLPPGQYRVTITDANTCAYFSIFFIIEAPKSSVALHDFLVTDASCFEEANGSILIDVVGGTPPYFFNWDLPAITQNLESVPAGEYHLTVFDENFCVFDTTFEVSQPDSLHISTNSGPASPGQSNGWAAVAVNGGTPPYFFLWETGETNDTLSNIPTGWYQVVVTDANFCQKTAWVKVETATKIVEKEQVGRFSLFPNPAADRLKLGIEWAQALDVEVLIFDALGRQVFSVLEENRTSGVMEMNVGHLPPGFYWVMVRANGAGVFEEFLMISQ